VAGFVQRRAAAGRGIHHEVIAVAEDTRVFAGELARRAAQAGVRLSAPQQP
jgi:hypothetical protein